MKKKVLLAIADGVGDRPCEELGWKTPLQYADVWMSWQKAELAGSWTFTMQEFR